MQQRTFALTTLGLLLGCWPFSANAQGISPGSQDLQAQRPFERGFYGRSDREGPTEEREDWRGRRDFPPGPRGFDQERGARMDYGNEPHRMEDMHDRMMSRGAAARGGMGMMGAMMHPGRVGMMGPMTSQPGTLGMMMILMDTDGDGTVSLQEYLAAQERIFKAMDTNKDGRLTLEEVQNFRPGLATPRDTRQGGP